MKVKVNKNKPSDWPRNQREASLTNVFNYLLKFIDNPSVDTKEYLLALVNQDDVNQSDDTGLSRYTDYEISLINTIYLLSKNCNFNEAISYIYRLLMRTFVQRKMLVMVTHPEDYSFERIASDDPYLTKLTPELRLFYYTYGVCSWEKDETYAGKLISIMNEVYDNVENEMLHEYFRAFNLVLYDLSFNTASSIIQFSNFTRNEIIELFGVQSKFANRLNQKINLSPLKGVFAISLSNWLLKSRNNYNQNYIYKCISSENMISASENGQLWLHKIEKLNDNNEGLVSKQILHRMGTWKCKDWMSDQQKPYGRSYIASYSKVKPDEYMSKEYGDCWVAYKNDKIATSIAPIDVSSQQGKPFLSQVISFDVTYDEKEFIEEINILGQIIDKYNLSNEEKNYIFNEVLHYWRYSIKEPKWAKEKERRYEIVLHDNYKYIDIEEDSDFLKVKTYSILCPDFCNVNNYCKNIIINNKLRKLSIETKPYYLCENCFFTSFDFGIDKKQKCPICGSSFYGINNNRH